MSAFHFSIIFLVLLLSSLAVHSVPLEPVDDITDASLSAIRDSNFSPNPRKANMIAQFRVCKPDDTDVVMCAGSMMTVDDCKYWCECDCQGNFSCTGEGSGNWCLGDFLTERCKDIGGCWCMAFVLRKDGLTSNKAVNDAILQVEYEQSGTRTPTTASGTPTTEIARKRDSAATARVSDTLVCG